jgi:hypothetical protein
MASGLVEAIPDWRTVLATRRPLRRIRRDTLSAKMARKLPPPVPKGGLANI